MIDLILRQGDIRDAFEMAEIEKICFSEPWSEESIISDIEHSERSFYIVAEIDSHIVGYIGCLKIFDEGHITNVAVRPEFRRKHIAENLINVMVSVTEDEDITSWTLEVRESNEPAKALYRKLGFIEAGLRKGYYQDTNEDAIIMWKTKE